MADVQDLASRAVEHFDLNLSACGHGQADRDSHIVGGINESRLYRDDEI
jgi:hypothetical protein